MTVNLQTAGSENSPVNWKTREFDLDAFAAFEKHSQAEHQTKASVGVLVQLVDFLVDRLDFAEGYWIAAPETGYAGKVLETYWNYKADALHSGIAGGKFALQIIGTVEVVDMIGY